MSLPDLTAPLNRSPRIAWRGACCLFATTLSLAVASTSAQQFELVDDLATGSAQSDLIDDNTDGPGVLINGFTLFQGCTETYGCELWRSDGTAVGTEMMVDLRSGGGEGLASHEFATLDGWAYFIGGSGFDTKLWRTDGTPEGTEVFVDRVASFPAPVVIDDLLWFRGDDDAHGEEPWFSDGTVAGTMMLADIEPGSADSDPSQFTAAGGLIYFAAQTNATGRELYATDGTEAGTYLVADIQAGPGDSLPFQLSAYGSQVLFRADDGTTGRELWRSDGTGVGTVRLEVNSGPDDSDPTLFGEMPGGFFLFAADDGSTGTELWRTNGTLVQQVVDFNPNGSIFTTSSDWIRFGDFIYFSGFGDGTGEELLRTDGTVPGTTVVADILSNGSGSPRNFVAVGTSLYFSAFTVDDGRELWATNGTLTQQVANLDGGSESSMNSQVTGFRGPGNTLLFAADVEPFGLELWRTDGTAGGTQRLTDVVDPASSDPFNLTPWQGGLAFQPDEGDDLGALVTVDGTSLFTTVDPFPFPVSPIATSLLEWQGDLYLSERSVGDTLTRLWKRGLFNETLIAEDTTDADQIRLNRTDAGPAFNKAGKLSVTDGTVVGDFALLELTSPPADAFPRYSSDSAWYLVDDEELWRTDLVNDTSELRVDLTGDPDLIFSRLLGEANGTFYFSAYRLVDEVAVETLIGATDTSPQGYSTVLTFDTPFFVDNDLFVLESGAVLLSDISDQPWQLHALAGPSSPATSVASGDGSPSFPVAGSRWLTFRIGEVLWRSDGTPGGTAPIDQSEDLSVRAVLDDWLVVTSTRPGRGIELSLLAPLNGLEILLPEVEPGPFGSIFGQLVVDDNDVLWASAFRSDVGQELFRLDLAPFLFDPATVVFWDGFESGDASAWSATTP